MEDLKNKEILFPIIIIVIMAIFFLYSMIGDNIISKICVKFLLLLIILTGIISIIRTIKEKNVVKIIPFIFLIIIQVYAFCEFGSYFFYWQMSDKTIELTEALSFIAVLYEFIDMFKIKMKINVFNIVTIIVCIVIVAFYSLIQIFSINKYIKGSNEIYDLIISDDLTYEKLINNFEPVVLKYLSKSDYEKCKNYEQLSIYTSNINKNSLYLTSSQHSKLNFMHFIESIVNSNSFKNSKSFNKEKDALVHNINILTDGGNVGYVNSIKVYSSIIIFGIELAMACIIGNYNRKYE